LYRSFEVSEVVSIVFHSTICLASYRRIAP